MNNSYATLQSKISSIESKVLDGAKQIEVIENEMKALIQQQQTITIQLNDKKLKLTELNTSCDSQRELLQKSKASLESINESIRLLSDTI
jgi:chromosome segregation ATPase